MGQCKCEHWSFKNYANVVFRCCSCCLFRKSKGKDFKRDYAKEELRENMGQCESKERDFKEQWSRVLRKDFRSEVLKNYKGVRS
jgi:hypothetical protein